MKYVVIALTAGLLSACATTPNSTSIISIFLEISLYYCHFYRLNLNHEPKHNSNAVTLFVILLLH
jgi:hypothetical protein